MDINLIGSIASILGLTKDLPGYAKKVLGTSIEPEKRIFIGMIKLLSTDVKEWKSLHMKYTILGMEFSRLCNIISKIENKEFLPLRSSAIRAIDIEHFFNSRTIIATQRKRFADYNEPFIKTVEHRHNKLTPPDIEDLLAFLRDKGEAKAAEYVLGVINSQKNILKLHKQTVDFFSKINNLLDVKKFSWNERAVQSLLEEWGFLCNDFPALLGDIDSLLFNYLELFILVSDEIKA